MFVYAIDNEGILPESLDELTPEYLEAPSPIICPRTSPKYALDNISEEPYEYLVSGTIIG